MAIDGRVVSLMASVLLRSALAWQGTRSQPPKPMPFHWRLRPTSGQDRSKNQELASHVRANPETCSRVAPDAI